MKMSCPQFGYNGTATTTQLLMAGQSAAGQPLHSSAGGTGPGSGGTGTNGGTTTGSGGGVPSAQPCCESGRPVLADPVTGQTVCSCQYDAAQLIGYSQRLAAASAAGLSPLAYGVSAASVAAAAAAAAGYGSPEQPFLPLGAAEQSAFYSPTANGFDLKDNLDAWRSLPYAASMYYPYDSAALAGYPFPNGYGVDLNGARRKNATRETTSTLKAWLNEHRKNPYPTKGEKIMLAIITKMTLTQVSTWFANARRRLKKENKMTWSPRNRCDDDDADVDTEEPDRKEAEKSGSRADKDDDPERRRDSSEKDLADTRQAGSDDGKMDFVDVDDDCKSCASTSTDGHVINSSDKENCGLGLKPRVPSPVSDASLASDSESSQSSPLLHGPSTNATELPPQQKPRIWSIVDTATSGPSTSLHSPPGASSRLSPLQRAAYLSPYPKPSSWYAGTLGNLANSGGAAFPLYSCPPIGSSMAGSVVSSSSSIADASAVSSLNRLRTAAAAFPSVSAGEMAVHKGVVVATSSPTPSVFNLSAKVGGSVLVPGIHHPSAAGHHSSGSAAAIAAMASGNGSSVSSSLPSQGRVLS